MIDISLYHIIVSHHFVISLLYHCVILKFAIRKFHYKLCDNVFLIRKFSVICADIIYHCMNGKWLAVDKADGKIEREIVTSEKGLGFWKVSGHGIEYKVSFNVS